MAKTTSYTVKLFAQIAAGLMALCRAAGRPGNRRRMLGGITPRQAVAVLSLSAAGLVGIVVNENYTDKAVVPTKGDRPTVGFGSTSHENGTAVRMGDSTTPVRALIKAQVHISREEAAFRDSLPGVALHQGEYDLYMDWLYQYGSPAWKRSSMRRELLAGNYVAACDALLRYKFSAGYDCSTPGNKRCAGVWTRQLQRHKACMEMQP
ncbi:Phage-related lysozyme (muramidase), GH24 family [Paracidovorax valerianellae]|uniref:Lysozyme n=1 Tax=Paracidovorax valerianellae TaxID=187868 RepID=A0A1G6VVG5_9BURK|nr:lysozyme [Paracidovorax valerianellae]SDD56795.1 Phage-related lysozyme (muramidase), GH24 family [Paracidovorax valerianellae]